MNENILIACPISDRKDYVIRSWAYHAQQLKRHFLDNNLKGRCHILLVDNSTSPAHARKVERLTGASCHHIDVVFKNNFDRICSSRNYIRNYFLNHNFTHLFSLECDVFPPLNTLDHLLSHNMPVIGHTYFLGRGEDSPLMVQKLEGIGNERIASLLSLNESIHFIDGTLKKVFSIGLGCLLIKRQVIEKIEFRTEKGTPAHDDSFFSTDCHIKGIPIICDTRILPEHKNIPWNQIKNPHQ